MHEPLGDLIDGAFTLPAGEPLRSVSPVDGRDVFSTSVDPAHVRAACDAADAALPRWRAMPLSARHEALARFSACIDERKAELAEAIRLETGKLQSEAMGEVASLVARLGITAARVKEDLREGSLPGFSNEILRYHAHGVVGVIGPYNFPLHLCHAYALPSLLLGNSVVVKPSEVAPLSAQRYAEAAVAAGLPPGVLNVVQGTGRAGAALLDSPALRGLFFTGSWPTGKQILARGTDRPDVLMALEMGGKNVAVVLDDADVRQAAHEIALGGYLSAGQRCTCTDRVLVARSVRDALVEALARLVRAIRFGDPLSEAAFAGPLATVAMRARYEKAVRAGEAGGAAEIARGEAPDGGAFVPPVLHALPDGAHDIPGYTDTELFGPDLHVETIDGLDEAIAILRAGPTGLTHSVFTASEERFERFFQEVAVGILNHNRSTNRASPRLPFGGVGKSNNFRPGGSFAPRAATYPVAVQTNLVGVFQPHPLLSPHLVAPNLERLEELHAKEEAEESSRRITQHLRPLAVKLPAAGKLPKSEAWLERLYADNRTAREKKPGVFDHLRSSGPWFVSIDDEPLSVLDGMSQTATLPAGFAASAVVRCYVEGGFGDTLVTARDTTLAPEPAAEAYAARLRELVPGPPHVTFVNSGAESCEKALALCRLQAMGDRQRKVLAFEGGFHGRTLLSLYASHNPSKRVPFEISGYEVTFAPFPVWWTPHQPEPEVPEDFFRLMAEGDLDLARGHWGTGSDALLAAEVASLAAVDEALKRDEYFAVIVEPMQSEGGDRYATRRFYRALRLLTRFHGVPLIFDEVQTGFGLGGTFAWHTRFELIDRDGNPDGPDCITFAKRAQVGVVMSLFEDPEPTCAHPASLVRGRVFAELAASDPQAAVVEKAMRAHLAELSRRHPHLVQNPRVTGYASAFDLPTPEHLNAYVAQRFWRGNIVFVAGTRTVRHRLSSAFGHKELDALFEAMHRSLAWLEANPGLMPPAWVDIPMPKATRENDLPPFRIRKAEASEKEDLLPKIVALEARVFEKARRDPLARLSLGFDDPHGLVLVLEVSTMGEWHFAGFVVGAPLEHVRETNGPDRDPMLDRGNTFYTVSLAVDPAHRGLGFGRELKRAQVQALEEIRRDDGSRRYLHAAGRHRVGRTVSMEHVNFALGAYQVELLQNQYGENAEAIYYRMPLGPPIVDPVVAPVAPPVWTHGGGISQPFAAPPASLARALREGELYGPAVNKLTICNYVTPAIVRAIEWVSALTPALPHVYITSSRDEAFDKSVRTLRFSRKSARVALGLAGGYFGHTTAAARSLSDPAVVRQGPGYFDEWGRVPHPAEAGVEASLAALGQAIEQAGGPDSVIGFFLEAVQERTGRVIPDAYWVGLRKLRRELGIPVVLSETTTACYRSGRGAFFSDAIDFTPDVMLWWGGGQIGFVHVGSTYFIGTPLMMVSTWDGDELSLVRVHHHLRAARQLDLAGAAAALEKALAPARAASLDTLGGGLYRVLGAGDRADAIDKGLRERGVALARFPGGRLGIAPPLDRAVETAQALETALAEVLA